MGLLDSIIAAESGGNATARNPRSSAYGLGQFIESTWLDTLSKHRPDLITGKSKQEILDLRSDPALSREMTAALARDNAGLLAGAGLPTSPASVYLAHFAGPQGAINVLKANPETPVVNILDAAAVKANPFLASMSASDLQAWAARKMGGQRESPAAVSAPSAPVQPPTQLTAPAATADSIPAPFNAVPQMAAPIFAPPQPDEPPPLLFAPMRRKQPDLRALRAALQQVRR